MEQKRLTDGHLLVSNLSQCYSLLHTFIVLDIFDLVVRMCKLVCIDAYICLHYTFALSDNQGFLTDIRILRNLGQLKDQQINGDRLILPLISLLLGIAVLIYCELTNIDFATYLLYVLVSNVIGSTLYYVGIMKVYRFIFSSRNGS